MVEQEEYLTQTFETLLGAPRSDAQGAIEAMDSDTRDALQAHLTAAAKFFLGMD